MYAKKTGVKMRPDSMPDLPQSLLPWQSNLSPK